MGNTVGRVANEYTGISSENAKICEICIELAISLLGEVFKCATALALHHCFWPIERPISGLLRTTALMHSDT